MTALRDTFRHRASEPFAPRPTDLLADRLRVLAASVRKNALRVPVCGLELDADALDRMVDAQTISETELTALWAKFRGYYASYTQVLAERRVVLESAIEWIEQRALGPETKRDMRLCRLRRPPLAKVRAAAAPQAARFGQPGQSR